jgi:hypothetical protein
MTDDTNRPEAERPDTNPRKQAGEEKGTIKGSQRPGDNTQATDLPRGSEVETRNSSNNRG